jgi:hypothetical protein
MQLLFREKRADEVEQEVTQRDQFNTDEVSLVATVGREPTQNSLDARAASNRGPVRITMRFVPPSASGSSFFGELFSGLRPHLEASEIDLTGVNISAPSFLVIEDYGTTGLSGNYGDPDDNGPFNDFWRRVGKSHKEGNKNGRWGLGKLVFSSASKIRTFFGLTIRDSDAAHQRLLMGQVVLATHKLADKKFAPHGFFALPGAAGLQLPVTDAKLIGRFSEEAQVARRTEPGLSIVIPHVLDEITPAALIPEIIRNYFFPILTGQLEVEVNGILINASTFDDVASRHAAGSNSADADLIAFIRAINAAREKEPGVTLNDTWAKTMESAIDSSALEQVRRTYNIDRGLIHVRIPIALRKKTGAEVSTWFDLFLQKAPEGKRGDALYVRSAITVPDEARYFRARQVYGALVASDGAIASFLGDAENPAHTRWNGAAEKLEKNWKAGKLRLSEIRNSLNHLYETLSQAVELREDEALIDVFSIPDVSAGNTGRRRTRPTDIPPITPSPKLYRILERQGGFSVAAGPGLTEDKLPLQVKVRAAYDVLRGDPFKRFNALDFDLTKDGVEIEATGADFTATAANEVTIEANDVAFRVDLDGFDRNRDLMVRATR